MSNGLRWALALPLAIISGYLAYLLGGFFNNASLVLALGVPLEGWLKVAADAMAHSYMGAAFVYCGVRVAPATPKAVATGGVGILAFFACISFWSSFMIGKYYAIPAISGLLLGGVAVLVATLSGEIVPYRAGIWKRGGGPSKADPGLLQ